MVLNMITYKFYVGKDVYEFTAESKLSAMEMCNRQVIDKLDLHPMAWFDAGQNAFSCQSGNFFDYGNKMKIETAIGILNKEREFLGMGFLELLQDIQLEGKMVYSEKTMEAFERFMVDGRKMFAPVAE